MANTLPQLLKGIHTHTPLHLSGDKAQECTPSPQMVWGVDKKGKLRTEPRAFMWCLSAVPFCVVLGMHYVKGPQVQYANTRVCLCVHPTKYIHGTERKLH